MTESPFGLLVLDKPLGRTSYDCVHRVKKILAQKKVGHCGTLDPLAEGVLLVLVGKATRLQDSFLSMEKQYWLRAELGHTTTTGDREGDIVERAAFSEVTEDDLRKAAASFLGEQLQTPPRFAALKYHGKPYYKWAREGVEIPRVPRSIHIYSFEVLRFEPPYFEARVTCSRGTYVRTLVEDVARRVGTVATLDALIRERVGPYERGSATGWEQLLRCSRSDLLELCDASVGSNPRHV